MKKLYLLLLLALFVSNTAFAVNTGKEITSKCRANLKQLNDITAKFLSKTNKDLLKWAPYKLVFSSLIPEDYIEKPIVSPSADCKYYLISIDNKDFQWYCDIHGVIDGDNNLSFRYHEHQMNAKTCSRYKINENYEKHCKDLLHWTEYTPTPKEFFLYHYNMNPKTTTILAVIIIVGGFLALKSFFRF